MRLRLTCEATGKLSGRTAPGRGSHEQMLQAGLPQGELVKQ